MFRKKNGNICAQGITYLVLMNGLESPRSFCKPVKRVSLYVKRIWHRPVQHCSVQHLRTRKFSISELSNSNGQIITEVPKSNVQPRNYVGVRYDTVRYGCKGSRHREGVAGEAPDGRADAGGND